MNIPICASTHQSVNEHAAHPLTSLRAKPRIYQHLQLYSKRLPAAITNGRKSFHVCHCKGLLMASRSGHQPIVCQIPWVACQICISRAPRRHSFPPFVCQELYAASAPPDQSHQLCECSIPRALRTHGFTSRCPMQRTHSPPQRGRGVRGQS